LELLLVHRLPGAQAPRTKTALIVNSFFID
jgi:hypothetical protein